MKEIILSLAIFSSLGLMMYLGTIASKNINLLKKIVVIESRISLLLVICMWIYSSLASGIWISRDNYLFKSLILILVYNIFVFLVGLIKKKKQLTYGYINITENRGYGRYRYDDTSQCIGIIYVLCLIAIVVITVASGTYLIYGE